MSNIGHIHLYPISIIAFIVILIIIFIPMKIIAIIDIIGLTWIGFLILKEEIQERKTKNESS
jgi:hypothetical protein